MIVCPDNSVCEQQVALAHGGAQLLWHDTGTSAVMFQGEFSKSKVWVIKGRIEVSEGFDRDQITASLCFAPIARRTKRRAQYRTKCQLQSAHLFGSFVVAARIIPHYITYNAPSTYFPFTPKHS